MRGGWRGVHSLLASLQWRVACCIRGFVYLCYRAAMFASSAPHVAVTCAPDAAVSPRAARPLSRFGARWSRLGRRGVAVAAARRLHLRVYESLGQSLPLHPLLHFVYARRTPRTRGERGRALARRQAHRARAALRLIVHSAGGGGLFYLQATKSESESTCY